MATIRLLLLASLFTGLTLGCHSEQPDAPPFTEVEIPIEPGQVWTYKTRAGEERSRVTVCLVETNGHEKPIIHLAIDGLKLKNPNTPEGLSERMGHMAVFEDAFRDSVRTLESKGPVPAFNSGYDAWKESKGGAWDLPIAEVLDAIEEALKEKK